MRHLTLKTKNGDNMLEAFRAYAERLEEFEELQSLAQPVKLPHDTLLTGSTGEALDPTHVSKTLERGIQDFGVASKVVTPSCAVGLTGWQKGLHDFDMGGVD